MTLSISFGTVQLPAGSANDHNLAASFLADRTGGLSQSAVKSIGTELGQKDISVEAMVEAVFALFDDGATVEFVGDDDLLIVELGEGSSNAVGLAALKSPGVADRPFPVRSTTSEEPAPLVPPAPPKRRSGSSASAPVDTTETDEPAAPADPPIDNDEEPF